MARTPKAEDTSTDETTETQPETVPDAGGTSGGDTETGSDPSDVADAEQEAQELQENVEGGETDPDSLVVDKPGVTTLDADIMHPGVVEPGDTPHDTVLTNEHASSVTPIKSVAAAEGFGVVNAVVPIPDPSGITQARARAAQELANSEHRMETYEVTKPNGEKAMVLHDLDAGTTKFA